MTNFERIKEMSVEELAQIIDDFGCFVCPLSYECSGLIGDCNRQIENWLNSEFTP